MTKPKATPEPARQPVGPPPPAQTPAPAAEVQATQTDVEALQAQLAEQAETIRQLQAQLGIEPPEEVEPPAPTLPAVPLPPVEAVADRIQQALVRLQTAKRLNEDAAKKVARSKIQHILDAAEDVLARLNERQKYQPLLQQLAEMEWPLYLKHDGQLREAYRISQIAKECLQLLLLCPGQVRWALHEANNLPADPQKCAYVLRDISWQVGKVGSAPSAFDSILKQRLRPALLNFEGELLALGIPVDMKEVA